MAFTTNQAIVAEYYVAALGRLPDQAGFNYWTSQLDAGMTPDALMGLFLDRSFPEVATRYPEAQTNGEFISSVYQSTFGREADTDGLAYWTAQLDTKTQTEVLAEMLAIAKDPVNAVDAAYLANQKALAETALDTTVVVPGVEGTTYELTGSTDKLVGTDDNDTFEATLVQSELTGAVANALSSADKLDGGAGTDTLNADLVRQFSFNGDVSEVSPKTTSVEIVEFNAQDTTSEVDGKIVQNTITVDAEKMTGVEKIGSYYSDGDLVIENLNTLTDDGTIRLTSDMTITMNHTDNFNSDEDASDLTVYFDEDYLNTTSTSGNSSLTINMINTLNLKLDDDSKSDIAGFKSLDFNVGSTKITVNVEGLELSEVKAAIETALTTAGFTNITVGTYTEKAYFGTTIYYEDTTTTYNAGDYAGEYTAFTLVNKGEELLTEGGYTLTDGQRDGSLAYSQDDKPATQITNPITVNVELEKVGQDGEGGNLVIGGKDQNLAGDGEEDQKDGIEVFNIKVLGNSAQPSDLGYIASTDEALKTVNVTSTVAADGTYASLRVREAFQGAANLANAEGLDAFNANGFNGANLVIGDVDAAENINTFTATSASNVELHEEINAVEQGVDYSVTTGAGADKIFVALDGDAVDAQGEALTIKTAAGDDMVTVSQLDAAAVTGDDVSDETTLALDNLKIETGTGADTVYLNSEHIYNVKTGADSDFVVVDADQAATTGATGTWTIGDGSDAAGTDWADSVLYKATVTVDFAGFTSTVTVDTTAANNFVATQADINAAVIKAIADTTGTNNGSELSRLLETEIGSGTNSSQLLTITSTVKGVNDLTINVNQPTIVAAAGAPAGSTTILPSDYVALEAGLLETGAVADSSVIGTATTEADLVTAMATIDGNRTETGAAAASDFVLDSNNTTGPSTATDGVNSTGATSHAIIDLGTGSNDLVVLDSDEDSADTVVFSAVFGKVSIVNFFDAQTNDTAQADGSTTINHDIVDEVVGDHILDFTAFLNDSLTASGSAASAIRVATTEDIVATAVDLNLDSNEVVIVNDWTNGGDATESWSAMTAASIDASLENTDLYGSLAATTAVADAATNLETGISSILMIENDANQGEYKVYNVETNAAAAVGSQFTVTALGTVDLGESYNVDSAEAANANFA